jgi:hypothetical protein
MEINRVNKIQLSALTYSEQRPFGEHAKIVYVNNQNGKPIVLQTPAMTTPFGLGKFEDATGRVKYSLDMSFRGKDENLKIAELFDFLNLLDDKIVTDAAKRGQEWFKKKNRSKDLCRELYAPSVKAAMENGEPTDKYPSTFKAKVPFYDGKFVTPVFDMGTKELLDASLSDALTKGSLVQSIVKLNGIWFAGGKFGISWEVKQLKVKETEKLSNYAFADSDDEDDDKEDADDCVDTQGGSNNIEDKTVLDSEDEEEEDL